MSRGFIAPQGSGTSEWPVGSCGWLRLAATLTAAQASQSQPRVPESRRSPGDHVLVLDRCAGHGTGRRARAADVPGPQGAATRSGREGGRPGAGLPRRQADRQEAARTCWSCGATATGSRPAQCCSSASGTKAELTPNVVRRVLGRAARALAALRDRRDHVPAGRHREGRRRRDAGGRRGRRARRATASIVTRPRRPRPSRSRGSRCSARRGPTRRPRARPSNAGRSSPRPSCWARDLVNTPAGDMPPAQIAREAQKMAREVGLRCKVWAQARAGEGRVRRHPGRRRRAA